MPLYKTFKSPFSCKVHIPQDLFHFLVANAFLLWAQLPLGEQRGGKLLTTKLSNGSCPGAGWNIDVVRRLLESWNVSWAIWRPAPALHNSFQERGKWVQILQSKHFQKASVLERKKNRKGAPAPTFNSIH